MLVFADNLKIQVASVRSRVAKVTKQPGCDVNTAAFLTQQLDALSNRTQQLIDLPDCAPGQNLLPRQFTEDCLYTQPIDLMLSDALNRAVLSGLRNIQQCWCTVALELELALSKLKLPGASGG